MMISFNRNRSCCHLLLFISILVTTFCCTTTYAKEHIVEFSSVQQTETFLYENKHHIEKVRYTYDSDLLKGAAVEFVNESIAKRILLQYPDIVQHWPIHNRIRQQAPITRRSKSFENNGNSSLVEDELDDDVVTTFVPQRNDTLRVLTQSNYIYEGLSSNGAGIKVGIIDSGVDYTLPALGGCFGPNCKVAYGYDLVGNNFNGSLESIQESNDPMDSCTSNSTSATGHGTFIAGIIAAEDKEYNWSGVAPGVTLGMWRVYGCKTQVSPNDVLIKAMEMAYKAGMNVINISLGVSGGWAEDVLSVVADRLVSQGVHVITASGNIGTSGIFLTASPATGRNVIATGSIMNNHVPGYTLKLFGGGNATQNNDNPTEIPYRTFVSSPLVLNGTLPLVPSGNHFNAENDACHNLTSSHHSNSTHTTRFNGSIVLIHAGGCSSSLKIMHAREVGAQAVILYTDVSNDTTNYEVLNNAVLPVAFINQDDGKLAFEANAAQFTNILMAMEAPEAEVNSVSGFSTLGPTNELDLKPELMAVGGNVFSTLPRYLNSYGFRSGTSFSTPYIAGAIALFLSNTQRDANPDLVKHLLMNSAHQVKGPISAIHYGDSPIRQGAGVIDVAQAIKNYNQFHVLPAKLSLNDTRHFEKDQIITVYNQNAEKDATFQIAHVPSLTVTGYTLSDNMTNFTPREPIGLYGQDHSAANVTFNATRLVIPAGQSLQVRVHIQPPQTFSLESHALYGGYISITDEASPQQHKATIPYFGMVGNMHDLPILDRSSNPSPAAQYTFPSIGLANGLDILKPNDVGHFHIQHRTNASAIGGPFILARLLTGTKILQFQVISENDGQVIGDVPIDETRYYMMRNTLFPTEYSKAYYTWQWQGNYVPANVTLTGSNQAYEPAMLTSGTYRLKLRGLRVNGNMDSKLDWDEWTSPKLLLKIE